MSQKVNNQRNNDQDNPKKKGSHSAEELRDTGSGNNASGVRGGTTDMDVDDTGSAGIKHTERGSGISTKRNVTGSDFDGQPSE